MKVAWKTLPYKYFLFRLLGFKKCKLLGRGSNRHQTLRFELGANKNFDLIVSGPLSSVYLLIVISSFEVPSFIQISQLSVLVLTLIWLLLKVS